MTMPNTLSPNELDELARSLGVSQREQLFDIGVGVVMETAMRHGLISYALIRKGLLTFRRRFWLFGEFIFYLTPLGLALRDYLRTQAQGASK